MYLKNLIKAKFKQRYKRFFMEVGLADNRTIIAYTPNTGSMKTLLDKENFIYVEKNNNPQRKLKYTAQIVEFGKTNFKQENLQEKKGKAKKSKNKFCLINTHLPNYLVREGIEQGLVEELKNFDSIESEVKYGQRNASRIDILLNNHKGTKIFVEVKNATLKTEEGVCAFPDAPTKRGRKHLKELQREVKQGNLAIGFFLVARNDCDKFRVAREIDEKFYQAYLKAKENGVEFLAYGINFQINEDNFKMKLGKRIEILD